MKGIGFPRDEPERLTELYKLRLLDTAPEEQFDRLTRIARRLFNTPIVTVSFIDNNREWFKSSYGLSENSFPRHSSFASHAILKEGLFILPDTRADERFKGNELVVSGPRIGFYAACPIKTSNGARVGVISIAAHGARTFSAQDQSVLRDLADMVDSEIQSIEGRIVDQQTQLWVNRGFQAIADQGLNVCKREKSPAVAIVFDVHNMNSVDLGKNKNEMAANVFAQQLKSFFRGSDIIGRLGGDEFTALLLDARSDHVDAIITKLQNAINIYNTEALSEYEISFEHGAAEFNPEKPETAALLLNRASRSMAELRLVV